MSRQTYGAAKPLTGLFVSLFFFVLILILILVEVFILFGEIGVEFETIYQSFHLLVEGFLDLFDRFATELTFSMRVCARRRPACATASMP